MKISTIPQTSPEENFKHGFFANHTNSFKASAEETSGVTPVIEPEKTAKLGIENIQEFTIFPKQVVDGKTIITA